MCLVDVNNWESTEQMYLDFPLYIGVSRIFGRNTEVYSSGFKAKAHGLKSLHKDQTVILACMANLSSAALYWR